MTLPLAALDLASLGIGVGLGVLGTLLGIAIWRSRFAPAPPRAEALRATLRDVRKGGVICLGGFGDDGDDLHLFIDRYAFWERGRDAWHVLEGDYRGRRIGIEWREAEGGGGALKVIAFRKLRVALDELKVDPTVLERAEKTPGATIEIDGMAYRLERSGEGSRHDDGHGASVPIKAWDLVAPEQHGFARIERERDAPPRASIGKAIAADAVEIFRVKGG